MSAQHEEGQAMRAQKAARAAANYRHRLRAAESLLQDKDRIIQEQNLLLVNILLQDQFADLDDFHHFIGLPKVTTPGGGIVFLRLELEVADLFRRKPHLAKHPAHPVESVPPVPEAPEAPATEPYPSSGGHAKGQWPACTTHHTEEQ